MTLELVVSLTDSSVGMDRVSPSRVGGKASSLAKLFATEGLAARVPKAHALTVDFFGSWVEEIKSMPEFVNLADTMKESNRTEEKQAMATALCAKLQAECLGLSLSEAQSTVISNLANELTGKLVAVRSSAPEEDGSGASFAGAFETKLAVETTYQGLETAIKECFASLWDYRVLSYKQQQNAHSQSIGFCVVVMEMVDSVVAGVAFSANPLNSDRDELVIDSSWGLGESVVDGSVTADRFVVDKITKTIIDESLGKKGNEKRLGTGGVVEKSINKQDPRYSQSSLSHSQIQELTHLVCLIEKTYGMPMDVEWAFVSSGNDKSALTPKLLQARPITTLHSIDPEMMTEPGAKRRLYFDVNVISEATTTNPFSTMDLDLYCQLLPSAVFGITYEEAQAKKISIFQSHNSNAFLYNGRTRQYANMGFILRYADSETMAEQTEMVDAYTAAIFRSKDFDRKKYRTNYWMPKGLSRNTIYEVFKYVIKISKGKQYTNDPEGAIKNYQTLLKADMDKFDRVIESDTSDCGIGLTEFASKLSGTIQKSLLEEIAMIYKVMPVFSKADQQRRNGETEEIKKEYEALCAGYEGDELMEMNIALYQLAQSMPKEIWNEYSGENGMIDLAKRIQEKRDLPVDFFNEWNCFMKQYGFDGQDQLFISCPRYIDHPELLVEKMRINALQNIKDPSKIAKEKLQKRLVVMAKQESDAKSELAERSTFWNKRRLQKKLSKIQKRNLILDNMMMIRNAPKLHLAKLVGAMRMKALKIEEEMIQEGRLEGKGDIFHLSMEEVDRALRSEGKGEDLMKIIRPRKEIYERALAANSCPILVDSRCRILKADPPTASNEPGTLVGAAISPGVATGKVRIIRDLSPEQTRGFGVGADGEHEDHILCAVVTGPAWTPLFASASAVVLQIGGLLQHGALCAREYGKPAVSNIDVYSLLKDGMTVSVDGNTGIVKILDHGNDE